MARPHQFAGKDFYRVLQVSSSASVKEIKTAYRRLALELHPDRHDGCENKLAAFKKLNEAYSVLIDESKRREYDFESGFGRYNSSRRTAPPYAYRKVYAPSPPPDWKHVWNHREHFDMHYGDGIAREAFRRMREEAKRAGDFTYQSPLGKGFSFESSSDSNPFSKRSPQGPPKMEFVYEEGEMDAATGAEKIHLRKKRIVEEMNERRSQRLQRTMQQEQRVARQQQQQAYSNAAFATRQYRQSNECVIL